MINDGLTHVQDSSHEKKHSMVMRATNSTIERKQSHVVLRTVQQKMVQLFEASKSHKRWPVRRDGACPNKRRYAKASTNDAASYRRRANVIIEGSLRAMIQNAPPHWVHGAQKERAQLGKSPQWVVCTAEKIIERVLTSEMDWCHNRGLGFREVI